MNNNENAQVKKSALDTPISPLHLVFMDMDPRTEERDLIHEGITLADVVETEFPDLQLAIAIVVATYPVSDLDPSLWLDLQLGTDIYEMVHESLVIPLSFSDIAELL